MDSIQLRVELKNLRHRKRLCKELRMLRKAVLHMYCHCNFVQLDLYSTRTAFCSTLRFMSTSDIEFTLRCSNLLTSLRVSHPLAHSTARQLLDAYTESTRFYHTLDHTRHLLSGYDTTSELIQNKDAVQLAIWFHDCVLSHFSLATFPWQGRN